MMVRHSGWVKLVRAFGRDRRGNVAIIFALAILPILAGVGSAIDYAVATKIRTQLQKAADSASLASISSAVSSSAARSYRYGRFAARASARFRSSTSGESNA